MLGGQCASSSVTQKHPPNGTLLTNAKTAKFSVDQSNPITPAERHPRQKNSENRSRRLKFLDTDPLRKQVTNHLFLLLLIHPLALLTHTLQQHAQYGSVL